MQFISDRCGRFTYRGKTRAALYSSAHNGHTQTAFSMYCTSSASCLALHKIGVDYSASENVTLEYH